MSEHKRKFIKNIRSIIDQIDIGILCFCVLTILFTFFTGGIVILSGKNTSVLEIIIKQNKLINNFGWFDVASRQFSDWYHFILPIMICAPTTILFIDGLQNKTYRYYLIREKITIFFSKNLIASFLSTIMLLVIGTVLFWLMVIVIFPRERNLGNVMIYGNLNADQLYNYFRLFLKEIIYALFLSSISYCLSIVLMNRYSTVTFTFLLNYMINNNIDRIDNLYFIFAIFVVLYVSLRVLKRRCLNC